MESSEHKILFTLRPKPAEYNESNDFYSIGFEQKIK
jgi:hypothetical protein